MTIIVNTSNAISTLLIDPTVTDVICAVNIVVLAEVIGLLGIAANIVTLWNFRRQGYNDGVNITLTFLAVSDLGALVFQQAYNMAYNPWLREYDMFMVKTDLCLLIVYTHEYFIKVSGLITSFTAVERCLCVVLPLKIKDVTTRDVALAVNAAIFLVLSLYLLPQYYSVYVDARPVPGQNRTILYTSYRSSREEVYRVSYYITDLFLPYFTFLVLIVCSVVIVTTLKSKSRWRLTTTTVHSAAQKSSAPGAASRKERRVVIMLTTVAVIFVACILPQSVLFTAIGVARELKAGGAYFEVSKLCYTFTSLLETINCSVNILVYYRMSSRYREEIFLIFTCILGDQKSKHFIELKQQQQKKNNRN